LKNTRRNGKTESGFNINGVFKDLLEIPPRKLKPSGLNRLRIVSDVTVFVL
jgi:hypothetical protein